MKKQPQITLSTLREWINDNLDGDIGLNVASVAANELTQAYSSSFQQDISEPDTQKQWLTDLETTIQGLAALHFAVKKSRAENVSLESVCDNLPLKKQLQLLLQTD